MKQRITVPNNLQCILQLALFAGEMSTYHKFASDNKISFHHVFLKDWSADHETLPYPPGWYH